jgi:serine/threonine-protein kinase
VAPPTQAEHYELFGELAQGGMATVYLGRRKYRRKQPFVAIKSMKQELAEDEVFSAMFLDEATLTQRIKHPNVVETLDVAFESNKLLIVMEYVEGVSLGRLLEIGARNRTSIPPRIAVAIICDLLRGLHAAHELRDGNGEPLHVVHRDVSPQNVLVGTDGVARILDFGVAKAASQRHVTMRGEIKGKLAYMPPEQARGETVDRRSDVYAAGIVLWESLVGRRLYNGRSEEELIRQIFSGHIDPPSMVADEQIPSTVDRVVLRALSQAREDRWADASIMADALARALAPAHRDEVTAFVSQTAEGDLNERRMLIQDLTDYSQPLDQESQTLQEILTGRAARLIREPDEATTMPVPPTPAPPVVIPTPPVPIKPSRSALRRERRRRKRRMRILFGFAIAAIGILLLMTIALVLGRRAREAQEPIPTTGTTTPTVRKR